MDRANPYEACFEAFLRDRRLGYVAVDECRRTELDEEPVKSLDFIVLGRDRKRLLVDVKGRRFPGGKRGRPKMVWETWSTREDVEGLERWQAEMGPDASVGLLVFVYKLGAGYTLPEGTADRFVWHGREFLMRAVPVDVYRRRMRRRSDSWRTVHLAADDFGEVVRPFTDFAFRPKTPAVLTP